MKSLKNLKTELLANPAVRQAYDAQAPEFELTRELIAARTLAGLTQGDVAARMGTKILGSKNEPAGVQSLEKILLNRPKLRQHDQAFVGLARAPMQT